MKIFSWICEPRPISKCKVVLDVYFRPFSFIFGVMFFQKMAICEYLILAIFGQFWLFWANFGPEISKEYFFQLFRCKKNNGITKSRPIWLFGKLGSPGAPKPTLGPKTPLNGPGRAKIGVNAPHVVQLTGLGPKKTNLNRSPTNSVLFTRNHSIAGHRCFGSEQDILQKINLGLFLFQNYSNIHEYNVDWYQSFNWF